MANKHSRDFGLHSTGAGKGDRPRTDTSSKAFQEGYATIAWGAEPFTNYKQTGPTKWTKKYK